MLSLAYASREVEATQDYAEQLTLLSREQGFPSGWRRGRCARLGAANQGHAAEGIAQMQQGLTNGERQGPRWRGLFFWPNSPRPMDTWGRLTKDSRLAEALAIVDKTGECWCEAELYRLQGILLLTRSGEPYAEAETCLQQALALARRQQAKSWELRAAMSLSRLWQRQGKRAEAYELLAPIYGWFTEGFDTADLQEARVLLEELT